MPQAGGECRAAGVFVHVQQHFSGCRLAGRGCLAADPRALIKHRPGNLKPLGKPPLLPLPLRHYLRFGHRLAVTGKCGAGFHNGSVMSKHRYIVAHLRRTHEKLPRHSPIANLEEQGLFWESDQSLPNRASRTSKEAANLSCEPAMLPKPAGEVTCEF